MQGMWNTPFLLLALPLGALSLACGSDFGSADGADDGATMLPNDAAIGSGGSGVGAGGSSSGSAGSGGSMGASGGGLSDDSGTIAREGGAIVSDAKPDVPRVMFDSGATGDSGAACLSSSDCSSGLECLFDIKGGCGIHGACMKGFDPTKPICNAISNSCSCSGHTVNVICNGLPNGYFSEPIAHSGAC
jgi:hypothetical protein